jgi:hypothetical protein
VVCNNTVFNSFEMAPRYYPINSRVSDEPASNIFDSQYQESHGLNRRLIVSSYSSDVEPILSSSCSVDNVLDKRMNATTIERSDKCFISSTSCSDDDENASYSDSSCEEALEQSYFRRVTTEGRDDDSDDDCIVFRRIEANILSYPRPSTNIRGQSVDCCDSDENDSINDMWTLKRAHPISEDDEDSSSCLCDDPSEIDFSDFNAPNEISSSYFVSFNCDDGITTLNPRKKQKHDDV